MSNLKPQFDNLRIGTRIAFHSFNHGSQVGTVVGVRDSMPGDFLYRVYCDDLGKLGDVPAYAIRTVL